MCVHFFQKKIVVKHKKTMVSTSSSRNFCLLLMFRNVFDFSIEEKVLQPPVAVVISLRKAIALEGLNALF